MVRIENSPDWCAVGLKLDREVENIYPVSAMLTGRFSGRTTTPVTYTLSHPNYLFGQTTYSQTARYCPQPPEEDDDDDPPSGDPSWYDGDDDDDDEEHYCWCCFWGACYPGCGCGCACDIGEGGDEPDEPVDPEPEDYDEASTNYPHMSGVLKIRDPLEYTAPIHLTVPLEHRNCCPCPDHATNWVSVVYKSNRLKVVDAATDMDFHSSGESLDVKIAGVSPSFAVGDAGVSFAANGDVTREDKFTVLGVGIDGGYQYGVGDVDLKMLNQRKAEFGLPIPVNTNLWEASELKLQTKVRLPFGNIHLGFEGSTAPFAVWIYDNRVGGFLKLASSEDGPLDISFAGWRQLVSGSSDSYSPTTWIYITAAGAGKATLVYRYWGVSGSSIVEDEARQVITAVNPSLMVDYDRDGAIDDDDVEIFKSGRPYRYWTNQCKIDGSVWAEPSLFERIADILVGNENSSDNRVNGTFDLLNLFPVAIDVGEFRQAWGSSAKFIVEPTWGSFNYALVNKSWSDAGKIRTETCSTFGGQTLSEATMNVMTNSGVQIDSTLLSQTDRSAMLVAEARARSYGMRLRVELGGVTVFAFELPMQITPVDEMFRFVSLRDAYDDEIYDFSSYGPPPSAGTDEELWNKDVFFVHGFNVSVDGAREWNREIFKRLWVSGSMARYWGVTWSGDYHIASEAFNGLHYHRDVRQALLTAPSFARLVNSRGHDAVVIGHSLGNMVVSESLLKGCNATKYFMLDAAVASEAYRSALQARVTTDPNYNRYVPEDWHGYDPDSWAANWYSWFQDDRGSLGWAGHFAALLSKPGLEIYNYYSTGDEVFAENDETPGLATGVFHWPTLDLEWPFVHLNLELDAYPWQKQEVFKGVSAAGSLSAGWGFHVWNDGLSTMRYSASEASQLVANGSIVTNAVFNRDVEAMFQPTISDFDKADILASHIPAVSSPAGKVAISDVDVNRDYNLNTSSYKGQDWGRGGDHSSESGWLHSDIKNMAYFFTFRFFNELTNKGGVK